MANIVESFIADIRSIESLTQSNRRLIRKRITELVSYRCRRETILTAESNDARARAEASFRKEERAKEGAKAMVEYQANSRMVREKTERLKALRLAKEAADKERAG
jgi:hypothetical protein